MIRSALILALLVPLSSYRPQYLPAGPHFPTGPVINPCLISAWPMNEGSGLTLNDTSTGGTNTATISGAGAVTWTANSIKSGVTSPVWSGTGNALATSTTVNNFAGNQAFSAAVWVNPTGGSGVGKTHLGTLNAGANFIGWELGTNAAYLITFTLINSFPSNALFVHSASSVSVGNLNYIVATYDGSKTVAGTHIYMNAVDQALGIDTNSLTSNSTGSGLPVRFGARNDASDEYTGAMAYAEVYNCVLTPTQVATYYASGPGIY